MPIVRAVGTETSRWAPLSIDEAVGLLSGAPFRWWISGGQALALHVAEQWRTHDDLDIGICRGQTTEVAAWFANWDVYVAVAGRLSRWDGRDVDADAAENNLWARRTPEDPWLFDLTVGEGNPDEWIYRRDRSLSRPWDEAVLESQTGVPYLAPELQLLFKSDHPRDKDHRDARTVIPSLGEDGRAFLRLHLANDHPWCPLLSSGLPENL